MKKNALYLILLASLCGTFSSCKKKKYEKNNIIELNVNDKHTHELENLSITVTHFNSTDEYSFTIMGNKVSEGEGTYQDGMSTYTEYDLNYLFSITQFKKSSPTTIEIIHNSPTFKVDLSGTDPANGYGMYTATNSIGGKKGAGTVKLEVVDLDKKIFRGSIENVELWGNGWAFATNIELQKTYFNFVEFTIIEEE